MEHDVRASSCISSPDQAMNSTPKPSFRRKFT